MATLNIPTASTAWTLLCTGAKALVLQCHGDHYLSVGTVAPGINDEGFMLNTSEPATFPDVLVLGGSVWVRALWPEGSVTYAWA